MLPLSLLFPLIILFNNAYSTRRLHPGLTIDLHWKCFRCPAHREQQQQCVIILNYIYTLYGTEKYSCCLVGKVHNLMVIWEVCASLCPALFSPV